ncbi:MAG: D-glycerate dehydrogenase [Alphaproteobacteria bacterium]|nr:D-glycerate dehydrogenase [Alphaproteobacteria bacterium]
MKHKVVIGFRLPDDVEREFSARLDARFVDGAWPRRDATALAALLYGCGGIVVTPPIHADEWLFEHLPASVRVVGTYSVGLDHVDLVAAKKHGIAVVNTPDVLTDAVAETALLLLLGAARRATESIALIRSGQWQGWTPRQIIGQSLAGRTLGIYGMGRIGRGIAARARAFGMTIAYHNTRRLAPALEEGAAYYDTPEALLPVCDALVLACPLTAATRGFLNAGRIALMKPTAIVVNIARGDVVVDDDLIAALKEGRLFAAGLDVFSGEPRLDARYYDFPNLFILPHIGSSTIEARLAMGRAVIDGVIAVLDGGNPGE